MTTNYTAIHELHGMCRAAGMEVTKHRLYDGFIVRLFWHGKQIADAIEHEGSYGHQADLLEEMGLMSEDDVTGCVTAEEVFKVWLKEIEEKGLTNGVVYGRM